MILSALLITGAVLWIVGACLELYSDGFTDFNLAVTGIAFLAMPFGIFAFWRDMAGLVHAKIGLVLTAIGMAIFALLYISIIGSGIRGDPEIAGRPSFIMATVATGLGVILLAIWLLRQERYPQWTGLVFLGGTALSLFVSFVPVQQSFQVVSNIAMAVTLTELAIRKTRGK